MSTTITNPAPSTPTPSTPAAEPQQQTMERIPNEYIASTPLLTLRGPGESSAPPAAPVVPPPAPVAASAAPAPAVEQQPAPATPPVDPAAPPAEPVDPLISLTHDQLMEHFRQQRPDAHPSLLKQLADREITYREQRSEIASLRESNSKLARMAQEKQQAAVDPAAPPSDGLTPFERSLRAPAPVAAAPQPAAPAPGPVLVQPQPAAPQPEQPPMPAYLQTPAAAEAELAEAMAVGDYQHAAEVRQQIFFMQQSAMRGQTEAMIRAEAERLFQERMGGIAPAMQSMVAQQQAAETQTFAIGQLKEAGLADIDTMFQPTSEQALTVNGEQYPDTPMNRMCAQFPWITQIHVAHPDPVTAKNLTLIARYRAGRQMWQPQPPQPAPQPVAAPAAPPAAPGLPPEAVAGELDRISRDLQASQAADRARAGINAGASAAASPSMPASERFLDSIGGGGVADPLRGLFAARR